MDKTKWIIVILAIITAVCLAACLWLIKKRNSRRRVRLRMIDDVVLVHTDARIPKMDD